MDDIILEQTYAYPINYVWEALTPLLWPTC
jgi:uncharacterized protein YndB with AHSA1/START domain